jgi:hypothetical protein
VVVAGYEVADQRSIVAAVSAVWRLVAVPLR